jgi:hypothetical protein
MDKTLEYIDTVDYTKLRSRIKDLVSVMSDLNLKSLASRRLRYVELNIEAERKANRLKADELYIPQHIIDMNIRREQSSYIQYVTQSPRAVVLADKFTPSSDSTLIERDASARLRYEGWQLSIYANVDGMQQNGYGIMEVVYDESKPGHSSHEFVQLGDFGYVADTRDIQESELISRSYFFSRTKLVTLASNPQSGFDMQQVLRIVETEPSSGNPESSFDSKDKSLYRIDKVMFRVNGIVQVAWCCEDKCDNWLRPPVPLFIGRRKPDVSPEGIMRSQLTGLPPSVEGYETEYPYVLFPYLISENDTISQLKGRTFLDQDCQEAASSLMSSFCTAHRRASGLYFSKDTDDPNNDLTIQKNISFEQGALINSKVKQFQLTAPDSTVMQAIQSLVSANQNETSQTNFAAMNRQDSRKTATEISAATQSAQALSTVQVVLFSQALRKMYTLMFEIIQSRVLAGLITDVDPRVKELYGKTYSVKPSGDTDVIERQQLISTMMQAWPVVATTAAAPLFLCDMLNKMFPELSSNYVQAIQQQAQQAQAQAQQAQTQQAQMMQQASQQVAEGITTLAKHKEFFSDIGVIHAYPIVQEAARKIEAMQQQQPPNGQPNQ